MGSGIRILLFLVLIVHDSDVFGFGEVDFFDIWRNEGLLVLVGHLVRYSDEKMFRVDWGDFLALMRINCHFPQMAPIVRLTIPAIRNVAHK